MSSCKDMDIGRCLRVALCMAIHIAPDRTSPSSISCPLNRTKVNPLQEMRKSSMKDFPEKRVPTMAMNMFSASSGQIITRVHHLCDLVYPAIILS